MAKFETMVFVMLALQFSLLIFINPSGGNSLTNSASCNQDINGTVTCTTTSSTTDIWAFVTNVDNWGNTDFILRLIGIAGLTALTGIAVASIFGYKTDFLIFGAAIVGFISWFSGVLGQLFILIRNEVAGAFTNPGRGIVCDVTTTTSCPPANLIAAILVGAVAFYCVMTTIAWWRGRDQ